jgi:RimJ/RimL family protein N-acetyltransferase
MILRCRFVTLRDKSPADIEDYVRWNTVRTEWQEWDAPWEHTPSPPGEDPLQGALQAKETFLKTMEKPLPPVRHRFEVEGSGGVHLGWTNHYRAGEDKSLLAIGIDLPDVERGARGAGTIAFALHAAYRFLMDGGAELYTETWSGNLRMIGLASRVGFVECARRVGCREVRGSTYDALRFILRPDRLRERCPWLKEAILPRVDAPAG